MPLACFGQMDSLEYRLRSHIRTSFRTFYILKIVLLPRNPWQHIAYLKLNQPKIKATKFPQKIVCGNATDTALYISANGNAAETLRKRETRPHFALTCFRPPEMWRKLEPSDFRKISEIRKRLISPCVNFWINLHIADFSSPPKASYAVWLCWDNSDNLGQVTTWNIISLKLSLSTSGRVQVVL